MTKIKIPANSESNTMNPAEEAKYKRKTKDLRKRLRDCEEENERLTIKLSRSRKNIRRLRIERSFLVEKLEELQGKANKSDSDSDISSEPEVLHEKAAPTPQKKDPNAPKRPANAFFFFCQLERANLKEANQEASLSDLTKLLGQKWKSLTPEEKKQYYDLYDKDKERYERELTKYNAKEAAIASPAKVRHATPAPKPQPAKPSTSVEIEASEDEKDELEDEEEETDGGIEIEKIPDDEGLED